MSSAPFFILNYLYIGAPVAWAMERELVSPEQMGRWLGITRCFRMLINACMVFLCGLIWDKVAPQYVFLAFIALDLTLRVPLLITMPETLKLRVGKQALTNRTE